MAELAYASDLKSDALTGLWVRVPPEAQIKRCTVFWLCGAFWNDPIFSLTTASFPWYFNENRVLTHFLPLATTKIFYSVIANFGIIYVKIEYL